MSDSDYYLQAEFLIKRGYVSGMTVDQLSDKLSAKADKDTPTNCHTRETVYDEETQKFIENRRAEAYDVQKRLISPGERTSAAIETYQPKGQPPLNQNDL